MRLAFIGFGNLGQQLKNLIDCSDQKIEQSIFFDDPYFESNPNNNCVFKFIDYKDFDFSGYEIIVGLGYKHLFLKLQTIQLLEFKNYRFFTFIHPSSFISPLALVATGVIIYPMCNVDAGVTIEKGALLNNSVIISHDSKIGACSFLAPGVTISGNSTIGATCFLGTGVRVSNSISIGPNSVIGIGSVVSINLEKNTLAIGNPLKIKNSLSIK